jgi:CRISPR-associated protein Csd1
MKAYLVRARRKGLLSWSFPEVTSDMDATSRNVPYRLGRLFATLEKLQEEALPGANTTIRDRFFGAASATPVTVFPRLVRGAQPHLGKVKRSVFFEKLIQEIVAPVASFPSHLSLEEQGLFTLGYYHQRQDFFTKKDEAANV